MTNARYETPPMFLTGKQLRLLTVAESVLYSDECENHCKHFEEGVYPCECPNFECGDGYLICRGFESEGGDDGD